MYLIIKHIHILAAAISGFGFLARGILMWRNSPHLSHPISRILPHIIDSLLLISAFILVFWSELYPFQAPWLTAKLVALIAYILLGTIALKRGKTVAQRRTAFILALATFIYIITVALSRSYWGPFGFF